MEQRVALFVFAFQVPDCLLCGSVPDGGRVGPDLLVDRRKSLPLLPADSWLPLLVYDLVEPRVEEGGEALAAVLRGRYIAGVVFGYLADIIRYVGHMGMIGQPALVIRQ